MSINSCLQTPPFKGPSILGPKVEGAKMEGPLNGGTYKQDFIDICHDLHLTMSTHQAQNLFDL